MARKIEDPKEYTVCKFDGVTQTTVYEGSFDRLRPALLNWRTDEDIAKYCGYIGAVLTLDEISEQLGREIITVFVDSPLNGLILQYGNYGDEWWVVGETCGYA